MKPIHLDDDVRHVLSQAVTDGPLLWLSSKLDRELYGRTRRALEAMGGTWNRRQRAHVFTGDARAAIAAAGGGA